MERVEVPKHVYEEICKESSELHVLKELLAEAKDIERVLELFSFFDVKPHRDLLYQIDRKDIPVSERLLKLWE